MGAEPHLLVVDDEDDFRESLALLLEMEGYRVSEAPTGTAALRLLASGLHPDLMLLDHRMPGLTGAETLDAARSRGYRMPAVLVTAAREAGEIASGHGFASAVTKPFSPEHLLAAIRQVLSGSSPA